ncbi:GNAT family N-acetyltransferase [Legionella sp. CNM-4043-24]|uniref:GNAT family N-acetyltransferase n=1 Tax=Legionella sp. CNM-4043-24 TaxID=3421646 RepID=UPI00403AB93D
MKNSVHPITLAGEHCTLVPLSQEHHDALSEAAADGELSRLWYTFVPEPQKVKDNIELRLTLQQTGSMLPFTVIDNQTQKAVGMTTYLNIEREHRRVEIGGTWYRKSAQRTAINTECKFLLLQYAFESMDCIAVEFRTHALNHQSRKGIERLGARLDGILRNHMIMPNGTLRDTYVYSIIASEWPTIKAHLEFLKHA